MDFEQLKFPHIMYISESQQLSIEERDLYYLGGEPDENNNRLTIGKKYELRTSSFSPSPNVDRISVWICSDDVAKFCQIDFKNFGTFADLRNKKIEKIIKIPKN